MRRLMSTQRLFFYLQVLLFALLQLFAPGKSAATEYTFTTIDAPIPGVRNTQPLGINNLGQIVGAYADTTSHGFLLNGNIFSSIDGPLPSALNTNVLGINDSGQMVGTSTGGGFLLSNGTFTSIVPPPVIGGGPQVSGINNTGQIVGHSQDNAGRVNGFVYSNGNFDILNFPGATVTQPTGINNSGQVVGFAGNTGGGFGFLQSNGIFTRYVDDRVPYGINNVGQTVGVCNSCTPDLFNHNFVETNGLLTSIVLPFSGAGGVEPRGINDAGQIVGSYGDATGRHGFLATPLPFSLPSATPDISRFPSASNFSAEVIPFVLNNGTAFSTPTRLFLEEKTIELTPLFGPTGLKVGKAIANVIIFASEGYSLYGIATAPPGLQDELILLKGLSLASDNKYERYGYGFVSTTLKVLSKLAQGNVVGALVSANSFIWGGVAAREFKEALGDPFDPNYQFIVSPELFILPEFPSTGNPNLDLLFERANSTGLQAASFLRAANISFDRYSSAIEAGDAISAGFQLEALLHFLSLGGFNDQVQKAQHDAA